MSFHDFLCSFKGEGDYLFLLRQNYNFFFVSCLLLNAFSCETNPRSTSLFIFSGDGEDADFGGMVEGGGVYAGSVYYRIRVASYICRNRDALFKSYKTRGGHFLYFFHHLAAWSKEGVIDGHQIAFVRNQGSGFVDQSAPLVEQIHFPVPGL